MDLKDYQDVMMGWNKASEDPDAVAAPTPEQWEEQQARLARSPHLTH